MLWLGLGLALGLGLGLGLGFDPSSPIVRELVLSFTRLSFPLVRFRHSLVAMTVDCCFLGSADFPSLVPRPLGLYRTAKV